MKRVALTVLSVGAVALGGRELLRSDAGHSPAGSGVASSKGFGSQRCWSQEKIKGERFSQRGMAGTIQSFNLDAVDGCVFRVKVEVVTLAGIARTLDYNAEFAAGDRPIFIKYNAPP